MKTIPELLKEYIHEYCRTTGKDGNFVVSYSSGWFRLCQSATAVRRAEFEKMIETLKSRPTVMRRQEMVNGVLTWIEAHQHVVKSLMPPHKDVIEDRDTPYGCSVKDEAYWSS
jgi:hypothetical protein